MSVLYLIHWRNVTKTVCENHKSTFSKISSIDYRKLSWKIQNYLSNSIKTIKLYSFSLRNCITYYHYIKRGYWTNIIWWLGFYLYYRWRYKTWTPRSSFWTTIYGFGQRGRKQIDGAQKSPEMSFTRAFAYYLSW